MTRRRREHGPLHDIQVAVVAIVTIGLIWVMSELTDFDPEPPAQDPPAQSAPDLSDRRTAAQLSASRSDQRTAPAPSARRGGAPSTPAAGRERGSSRPVVGQALRCIRWHESRDNYQAFNGIDHYGAYQLAATYSGAWARRYGHPDVARLTADQWPRAIQDDVARQLFADWPRAWTTYGGCA